MRLEKCQLLIFSRIVLHGCGMDEARMDYEWIHGSRCTRHRHRPRRPTARARSGPLTPHQRTSNIQFPILRVVAWHVAERRETTPRHEAEQHVEQHAGRTDAIGQEESAPRERRFALEAVEPDRTANEKVPDQDVLRQSHGHTTRQQWVGLAVPARMLEGSELERVRATPRRQSRGPGRAAPCRRAVTAPDQTRRQKWQWAQCLPERSPR